MDHERIVAVGLLTQGDLDLLGPAFKWAWPIENVPAFDELIEAIDEADEHLRRSGSQPVG
jgi:hypothetical protein